MKQFLNLFIVLIALSGCGSIYRSSDVVAGQNGSTNVRVLPVTAETILQANQSPYEPKTLPAVFAMTAGGGGTVRGVGVLPVPPQKPEPAPATLTLRMPPAVDPGPYAIGVGDIVLLSTPAAGTTVEELSGLLAAQNSRQGYTVQDDGTINIPNVGRVNIAGRTIDEAEADLFKALVDNQLDPAFSLEVSEFNSRRVSIGGAVGRPAVVPVGLTPLYLDEAIAAAGGIQVEDLDYASVRIYRDGDLYQIPLRELFSQTGLKRTRLIDGDSVFVDTEYELSRASTYFEQQIRINEARQNLQRLALDKLSGEVALRRAQLNERRENYRSRLALGEENRDYVYLTGEVDKQSRYALPFGRRSSLADALYDAAGGIAASTGDVSQVYVLRASEDIRDFGAVTAWHLNLRNAANLSLVTKFELRPDDVVFVAEQPVTRWGRAISQITPSLITTTVAAAVN